MSLLRQMSEDGSVGSFSVNTIIFLLLISGILFASFYLIKRYILPYLGSRTAVRRSKVFVLRLEVLLWSLFGLFAVYRFLSSSIWISIVFLVLLGLIGFTFFRNFFIGLVFRLENKFRIGDPVRIGDYSGIIENIGIRNIQLKTDDEELVFINYHTVSQSNLVKRQAKGRLLSSRIILDIGEKDEIAMAKKVRDWLYQCPWAVINERIAINNSEKGKLLVTVYAVDQASIQQTEEFLKKKLSN